MNVETIWKKTNEPFQIVLDNRGSCGLQLAFRLDQEGVAFVERLDTSVPSRLSPGDPVKAVFKINPIRKGTVKIVFYETQPWNPAFEEIVAKIILLRVDQEYEPPRE